MSTRKNDTMAIFILSTKGPDHRRVLQFRGLRHLVGDFLNFLQRAPMQCRLLNRAILTLSPRGTALEAVDDQWPALVPSGSEERSGAALRRREKRGRVVRHAAGCGRPSEVAVRAARLLEAAPGFLGKPGLPARCEPDCTPRTPVASRLRPHAKR